MPRLLCLYADVCFRVVVGAWARGCLLACVCRARCLFGFVSYECTSIYIPYLPKSLFGLLSSPVNFMVGVLKEDFADKAMRQQRAALNCYVVWLGKDKVRESMTCVVVWPIRHPQHPHAHANRSGWL